MISTFSWGQKRCAYFRKCAHFGKMCLFWQNVLILGKHAYFGKICLFWKNVLILESGGFLILGLVYTVKTLVLELDFLFIIFEKKFSDFTNVSSISSGCLFVKWEKNLPDFQISMLKNTGYFFSKISTISSRQKGCAFDGKWAYYGCAY